MSEEKRGFWSSILGSKKPSGCCSLKIEAEPEDVAVGEEAANKTKADSGGKESQPAPRRGGGCNCGGGCS